MRKSLNLITQVFLISSCFTINCQIPWAVSSFHQTILANPIVKDAKYYQAKIRQNKECISDCNKILKENLKNKDIYSDDKIKDEVIAEIYAYQSEIKEYQYQILLLAIGARDFNSIELKLGIFLVSEKIKNLKQELKLKEKYPEYYRKSELQKIKDAIEEAEKIKLALMTKVKEQQNVTV